MQERTNPTLPFFGDTDMRSTLLLLAARRISCAAIIALPIAACEQSGEPAAPTSSASLRSPAFTVSSGSTSTVLGRATFAEKFNIERKADKWKTHVESDPLDIAVQQSVFAPGAQSGWHSHPGPVFIMVVQGTMTFYEGDDKHCTPVVRTAGQGYLDEGKHAHIARNESGVEARNIVTYFAPPGAALRIDQPAPGNCPF
jgi:hypothetical protein